MYRYRLGHHGVAGMLLNVQSEALLIWQVYTKYFLFLINTYAVSFGRVEKKIVSLIQDIYISIIHKYFNIITYNYNKAKVNYSLFKEYQRGIHTNRKSSIWVYDLTNLDENAQVESCLVNSAPFKTKTECANTLKITRNTVRSYLDSEKILNNKWIFSATHQLNFLNMNYLNF